MFKVIKSPEEFRQIIHDLKEDFPCNEDWEEFFGFQLKWNEETGEILETIFEYDGEIKTEPIRYPVIAYITFDSISDFRNGDIGIQLFDYMYVDEIEERG